MKVVYWARIHLAKAEISERLRAVQGIELVIAESLPELLTALPGAQALVLYDAPPADARPAVQALSDPSSSVRWMHFITAGREGFEAVGLPRNVAVTYAAGAVSPAVAEHAMALLLAIGRRLPDALTQQAQRKWDRAPVFRAFSLEGMTMAIVGFGHIGRELAPRAKAFGMRVLSVSRSAEPHTHVERAYPMTQLDEALAQADVVVLALALTAQTRHLMDRERLARCKRGAVLINIARGGVVDQVALCEALHSGQLAGAGIDVTDPEPLPASDPLWDCPNLILSPHYAGGGSTSSLRRLAQGAEDNLLRFMRGDKLLNRVAG